MKSASKQAVQSDGSKYTPYPKHFLVGSPLLIFFILSLILSVSNFEIIQEKSMASSSLLLLQLQPLNSLSSTSHNTLLFHQNTHYIPPLKVSAKPFLSSSKPLTVLFALTESDSPKSLQPDSQTLLQELAVSID